MQIYSFQDLNVVIQHPALGQLVLNGQGIGTITFTPTTDRTVVDTAADGNIMMSAVAGNSATVSIAIQQTSSLQAFLLQWWNYLVGATKDQWGLASLTAHSNVMGTQINCTGLAPQKPAERPFSAQGQNVTWTLVAADMQQVS
jgi:hypothetical protein